MFVVFRLLEFVVNYNMDILVQSNMNSFHDGLCPAVSLPTGKMRNDKTIYRDQHFDHSNKNECTRMVFSARTIIAVLLYNFGIRN